MGSQRPARVQWLAERRSRALLKGRSHFLGFPLTNGRPRGRKRGQSGVPLSAPAAWRTTFQLEGGRGAAGVGIQGTGTSQKNRCPPAALTLTGSTLRLWRRKAAQTLCAHRADRALATARPLEAFRQTRPLECLRDGYEGWTLGEQARLYRKK